MRRWEMKRQNKRPERVLELMKKDHGTNSLVTDYGGYYDQITTKQENKNDK